MLVVQKSALVGVFFCVYQKKALLLQIELIKMAQYAFI